MRISIFGTAIIFALTACGSDNNTSADFDMAEEATESYSITQNLKSGSAEAGDANVRSQEANGVSGSGTIAVSIPQIAYSYKYGFRLPAAEIPKAQEAHVALCENRGPKICRVLNMENSGGEGDYATGMLNIEVAAPQARAFGVQLAATLDEHNGSQIATSISGEDLSKQIVDTEARLRSRVLLSQRLTELLRTKKGSVAELVEAERAVTQVNEEIDRARSWLKEMRGRVAFSKIVVSYQSGAPGSGGIIRPIREAFGGISSTLGSSVGAAITFISITLPWILILVLAVYFRRRFKAPDRTFWGRQIEVAAPADD
ncbi:hypothetical protein A8B75_07925 [Sphingomonadales bacterium EhC05]|nr:hypothetical protein A8B75_07925 [Sphingomonadales bacterium EhC05]